jgi:predicted amidophosphoribosyltransferase
MPYMCPVCSAEAARPGECDFCHLDLEKTCPNCGEVESQCVCGPGAGEEEEKENEGRETIDEE